MHGEHKGPGAVPPAWEAANGAQGVASAANGEAGRDTPMAILPIGTANNGTSRVDIYATAGEEYFLQVLGTNNNVDFRLTNLVSVEWSTVTVHGTAGNDTFTFAAGMNHAVSVNGVAYNFSWMSAAFFNFDGGQGSNTITMTGTTSNRARSPQRAVHSSSSCGSSVSMS
jgi:hypothetical protein